MVLAIQGEERPVILAAVMCVSLARFLTESMEKKQVEQ